MKVITKKNTVSSTQLQAYKNDSVKYAKLEKSKLSMHKQDNESIQIADNCLIVNDSKFYANNVTRIDKLSLSIDVIKNRVNSISLFDRKSLQKEFSYETTIVLRCDSVAKKNNLCFKSQIYSTLLRKIAIVSNRSDLLLMCSMSKSQQEKMFTSNKFFNNCITEQSKTLTLEQVKNSNYIISDYKSNYSDSVKTLKALLSATIKKNKVSKSSKKQKISKLVKSKKAKSQKITV